MKALKITRTILFYFFCIAFVLGLPLSIQSCNESAHNPSKVSASVTGKSTRYKESDLTGKITYFVTLDYKIKNNSRADWAYLTITTHVYDKKGTLLGTLDAGVGSPVGSSTLVNKGETVTSNAVFQFDKLDDFSKSLYESDFSDFKFVCEVTDGSYLK